MATKKEIGKKTYILNLKSGNVRRLTIPADWKLSFGQIVPFAGRGLHNEHHSGVALRIYERTKDNLRAVMTDVISIRDASIDVLEKRTSVKRQAAQKQTPQGMKDVVVEARMTEWVDPDKEGDDTPPDEFLKLPGGKDDSIEF